MAYGRPKEAEALVREVVRTFYAAPEQLFFEQLVFKGVMRDDELMSRTLFPIKDLNRIGATLKKDLCLGSYERNENVSGAMRASRRVYYFVDYRKMVDAIKWKMWKMSKTLSKEVDNEMNYRGYLCPRCKKSFRPEDVPALLSPIGLLICDVCGSEIVDNESSDVQSVEKETQARFMEQTERIVVLLKAIETSLIPSFDIDEWMRKHAPDPEFGKDNLVASDPSTPVLPRQELSVEMVDTIVDKEAMEKERVANALPSWLVESTVNGARTEVEEEDEFEEYQAPTETPIVVPDSSSAAATDYLDGYYADLKQSSAVNSPSKRQKMEPVAGNDTKDPVDNNQGAKTEHEPLFDVAGVSTPFSAITEADQSRMTTDEYALYAEYYAEHMD